MQNFMSEILAEKIRTGGNRKPDKNNQVSKRRRKVNEMIRKQSSETGEDTANVSLDVVRRHKAKLQRYVTGKGEQPHNEDINLSVQALKLKDREVKEVCGVLGCTYPEAVDYIDEAESISENDNESEADNFIGDIIGAVSSVANKAINKAEQKRAGQGKGTGLLKTLSGITGGAVPDAGRTSGFGKNISIAADEVIKKIKEAETKKQINKLLPFVIIGVVVIVLVTYLIAKKK